MQRLEFIYELGSQKPYAIWIKIVNVLKTIDEVESLSLYGEKIDLIKLTSEIEARNERGFNIENENFSFHLSLISNYEHILLQIDSNLDCENWWRSWVDEFVTLRGFVQAWLVDCEFDFWENASDPIEYDSKGKSHDGLTKVSNGLPAPLEQFCIDTSENLGLRKICCGYVEAIGAKMWFSDLFLHFIKKDTQIISNTSKASIKALEKGVYMLEMPSELFVDESSKEEQRKLREALYS